MNIFIPSAKSLTPPALQGGQEIVGALVAGHPVHVQLPEIISDQTPLITYQWYLDGNAIPGARLSKLDLTAAMIGHMISVEVTATTPAGFASLTTDQIGPIAAA